MKGTYKNRRKEGVWFDYHDNGQLKWKGIFKNGKKEGFWEFYDEDGIKDLTGEESPLYDPHQGSGLYKNGEKVE